MSDLPDDQLALDCGAGGRTMTRVVALEIVPHPHNDVQASGLDLPFRDGAFKLALSQAVIEHVTEPQRYVDEIFRVLQPGGLFYAEVAFMQPVHQAPHHYFNVTPYGMQHLCRAFEILEFGTVGLFQETIDWLYRSVNLRSPKRDRREPRDTWHAASGITLLGRKP